MTEDDVRPEPKIVSVSAYFACRHGAPIDTNVDADASEEVIQSAREGLELAAERAKHMPCLACSKVEQWSFERWTATLNGEVR